VAGLVDQHELVALAQHAMGRAFDHIDHERIGQLARNARP
jgi:hypothetical protein